MLTSGQRVGRYIISSAIGAGGMGEVYLAKDTELERSVAIKIVPDGISNDSERVQRFKQEARVVSALNHPNILTIHEIGSDEGRYFIASEYVEGQTLRHRFHSSDFELKDVLEITIQIASALDTAHRSKIVHRDIKPENIMVRDDGIVKVLDFGIAKLLWDNVEPDVVDAEAPTMARVNTSVGMILGTVTYMSPEQTRALTTIDERTDIWSLGVVLYEMLTGRQPFTGESSSDIMASILKTEPVRLSEVLIDCPIELERIVHKSLQKNRDERYQVVRELALDLKSLGKELEYSAQYFRRTGEMTNGGLAQTNRERAKTEGRTKTTFADTGSPYRFSYVLAALVFGLVAILGLWYFVRVETESTPAPTAVSIKSVEVVTWTSSPGEVYSVGSFSPDAKMVAFTSTKTGSKNIWIKQTASGEAIQITKDKFKNEQPIWSPSGDELAFFSAKGKQAGFWRMPILGGAPKLITTLDDGSARLLFWSDKDQIFYESKNDIFAIAVDSGEKRQITDFLSIGIDQKSITLSPDESRVAYTTVQEQNWTLWADSVEGKSQKQLVTAKNQIKNLVWHPDNKRIFYDTVVDGTLQIFVTDISGSPPRQISFADQDSLVLNISKDGTKILYGSAKEESDIWGVNLKDSKEFIVASDISSELWPDVSPDGTTLAYQTIKNLSQGNKLLSGDILTRPARSDGQPNDLIKNGGVPKWSPDGKKVAFIRLTGDKRQIETADPQGGQQKPVTAAGVLSVSNAVLPYLRIHTSDFSWSPDSARIAFVSRKTGQSNLWLTGSDVSDESQLSDNTDPDLNIYCPIWSRDGKRVAFTTKTNNADGNPVYGIRIIDLESKRTEVVTTGNSVLRLLGWSQDESSLILASTESSGTDSSPTEVALLGAEIATGRVRPISKLANAYLYNFFLSPDKQAVAFTANRDETDNVWIMPVTGGMARKVTSNNDSRLYFSSLAWSPDSSSIFFGKQLRYSMLSMLTNF